MVFWEVFPYSIIVSQHKFYYSCIMLQITHELFNTTPDLICIYPSQIVQNILSKQLFTANKVKLSSLSLSLGHKCLPKCAQFDPVYWKRIKMHKHTSSMNRMEEALRLNTWYPVMGQFYTGGPVTELTFANTSELGDWSSYRPTKKHQDLKLL